MFTYIVEFMIMTPGQSSLKHINWDKLHNSSYSRKIFTLHKCNQNSGGCTPYNFM